jgi:hypothetical protein
MATHAFVAYKLTVAPSGHPKDLVNLSNIDGHGSELRYLAHGFLQDIQREAFTDKVRKQYLTINGVAPSGSALRFDGQYGPYGQQGNNIIDIASGKSIHELSDTDAFTTRVRNMIVVPPDSTIGFFLAERHSGRGLASIFLRELGRAFKARFEEDKYVLHWEGLTNGEAWKAFLHNADLAQVRVIRHRVSQDIADEPSTQTLYNLSFTAKPTRGQKFFPRRVRDAILDKTLSPTAILGLDPNMEFDEARLELHGPEWQKEFALDQERLPVLIYPLGADGGPAPLDNHVYQRMEEVVTDLCPKLGVELTTNWRQGSWAPEALAVALEVIRGDEVVG